MIRQRSFAGLVAALLVLGAGTVWAQQSQQAPAEVVVRRQEIDNNAQQALNELFAERQGVQALYDRAAGYAVFTVTKAGFFVTGGGGTGVAVNKSTGERVYMRMGTGGLGLAFGAQRYALIIFFEDELRLNRFTIGGWDASANAAAAAGSDGVAVTSSFVDGIAFFQLTDKGLMAQADVSGTRFWRAGGLN